MPPGQSGFFLTARVSGLGSPSRAAVRCRLAGDGSPGRSAAAAVVAWCAGSWWCTAPHPLCASPGVCPWLVLVSADGRRRGHVRDRRGDPWLTAGLRPVRFASRCCAALCGVGAVDYSVAATVLIQTRLSPSVANATDGSAAEAGRFVVPGRITPRGKLAKPTCAGCPDPRSVVISETHVRCPWWRYCVGTTQSAPMGIQFDRPV
jgi:hypothetical protein